MANINLLPWREERRQEQQKEFLTILGSVVAVGILLVFAVHTVVSGSIDAQKGRNDHLKSKISELDKQVREIRQLDKKKQDLLERMKVVQQLQGNRPIIVRIFDETVRTVPDGTFYSRFQLTGTKIAINGTAESNNRISSLMRNLDSSDWFTNPNLKSVKANPSFGEQASDFQLSVEVSTPEAAAEEKK